MSNEFWMGLCGGYVLGYIVGSAIVVWIKGSDPNWPRRRALAGETEKGGG